MENNWISFLPVVACCFMVLALSGCQHKVVTDTIKTQFNPPPSYFSCEEAGKRPTGETIMESQVAKYIGDLEYSNKDCKTKLKQLNILVKCFNDSKCDVDKLAQYLGLVADPPKR